MGSIVLEALDVASLLDVPSGYMLGSVVRILHGF